VATQLQLKIISISNNKQPGLYASMSVQNWAPPTDTHSQCQTSKWW